DESWLRSLRDELHAPDAASFQALFGPGAAVILGDVQCLFMHAGVDAAGFGGIENDTPDVGRWKAGVAQLPRLAAVFGEGHANAPARYRDAVWRGRIEGNVGEVTAHPQTSAALKGDAAIGGHKQPAALSGGQPVARIVRRRFDAQHL